MSYSKTTWETGDTITAQLLNHAEDGIAANDAAIAAIPAGLQLYGPYSAFGTYTISGLGSQIVECVSLEDENGISVEYPDTDSGALVLVTSAKTDKGLLQAFNGPSLATMGPLGTVWTAGTVTVYNNTESSAEVSVLINFYSTVEFPLES